MKGSWSGKDHENVIPSSNANVKLGARFPDTKSYKDTKDKYIFRGMSDNPWWHGYEKTNYVAAYIYITQLANKMQYSGTVALPSGLSGKVKGEIDTAMAVLGKYWSKELNGNSVTKKAKRDFVWGMAIHTLTDSFAHSAHIWGKNDGKWVHLVHDPNNAYRKNPDYVGADDITKCPVRWENARSAVYAAMCQYEKTAHPAGTYQEFRYVQSSTTYKLGNIYAYVMAVAGYNKASAFRNSSYSTK